MRSLCSATSLNKLVLPCSRSLRAATSWRVGNATAQVRPNSGPFGAPFSTAPARQGITRAMPASAVQTHTDLVLLGKRARTEKGIIHYTPRRSSQHQHRSVRSAVSLLLRVSAPGLQVAINCSCAALHLELLSCTLPCRRGPLSPQRAQDAGNEPTPWGADHADYPGCAHAVLVSPSACSFALASFMLCFAKIWRYT